MSTLPVARATLAILLSWFALNSHAALGEPAEPPIAKEPADADPHSFSDQIDVSLVEIEVVVSDIDGAPITELEKEDFAVLVDGEATTITTFGRVRGETVVANLPENTRPRSRLSIMIVIDLTQFRRDNLTGIIEDLITETTTLLTGDEQESNAERIAIATIGVAGLELRQPLTDDPTLVVEALRTAARGALSSTTNDFSSLLSEIQNAAAAGTDPGETSGAARTRTLAAKVGAYASSVGHATARIAESCSRVVELTAGIEGDKVMLIISRALEIDPGEVLIRAMRDAADKLRGDGPHSSIPFTLPSGDTGGRAALNSLAEHAAERGVPLYSYFGSDPHSRSFDLGSAAPDVGSGSAPGNDNLFSPGLGGASRRGAALDASRFLAEGSGGVALDDPRSMVSRMVDDRRHAYILGLALPTRPRRRSLELDLEARGVGTVTYRLLKQMETTDAEAARRTRAAALGETTANPLGIRIETTTLDTLESGGQKVSLTLRVPFANITVEPHAEAHIGLLSIFVAEVGPDLATQPVRKIELPIRLSHDRLADALGRDAELRSELEISAAGRWITVGVRDELDLSFSAVATPLAP